MEPTGTRTDALLAQLVDGVACSGPRHGEAGGPVAAPGRPPGGGRGGADRHAHGRAARAELVAHGVAVFRANAKHAHDYQEIYDGVPSGHDAKSAAIVAKLYLERGAQSRRWQPLMSQRRALRVRVDELDWLKQDKQRAEGPRGPCAG